MGPAVLCVGLCQPVSQGLSSKQRSYKGGAVSFFPPSSRFLFRRLIISALLLLFFSQQYISHFFLSVSKDIETPEVPAMQAWV